MADQREAGASPYDFVLTRRPQPGAPPPFDCVACRRTVTPSPWPYDRHQAPPFCDSCTRHWSSFTRLRIPGATRGDMRLLARLSACVNLIIWEVHNGRR